MPEEHPYKNDKIIELLTTHNRVIFGDDKTGDIGIKKKIDELHTLLTQARNVSGFFGGLGGTIKWILVVAAVITVVKGWSSWVIHTIATSAMGEIIQIKK
jgi:hypothetical protein